MGNLSHFILANIACTTYSRMFLGKGSKAVGVVRLIVGLIKLLMGLAPMTAGQLNTRALTRAHYRRPRFGLPLYPTECPEN